MTQLSSYVRRQCWRAGLWTWQRVRRTRHQESTAGSFLGGSEHAGTSVLVWALEVRDPERRLENCSDTLDCFDTVVVVSDSTDFRACLTRGWNVEALPDHDTMTRLGAGADWSQYLSRRCEQLRYDWAPDFELVLGTPVEAFLKATQPQASRDTGMLSGGSSG